MIEPSLYFYCRLNEGIAYVWKLENHVDLDEDEDELTERVDDGLGRTARVEFIDAVIEEIANLDHYKRRKKLYLY